MRAPGPELFDAVVEVTRAVPGDTLGELACGLEAATEWGLAEIPAVPLFGTSLSSWMRLLRSARSSDWCTPVRLGSLLRGALASESCHARERSLEVAWTGPSQPLSLLRRTEQALLDVIGCAQRELWMVSFASYDVPSVTRALREAVSRRCTVRLLLESELESSGKLRSGGVGEMPADIRKTCACYVWPKEKRAVSHGGQRGLLHAKAAVADGEHLFLGSANLTEFAFDMNIELGILVRDRSVAGSVERQLKWLIESGTMEQLGSRASGKQ